MQKGLVRFVFIRMTYKKELHVMIEMGDSRILSKCKKKPATFE